MYLCFIDESNTPPKPTARNPKPYFIIAGVIIHEAQWQSIATEIKNLKHHSDYRVNGKEIKWRYFGAGNDDPDNSVRHLSQQQRDSFRSEMYRILTRRNSVKIVSCVASVAACYEQSYINNQDELYEYTYKTVSERFQYFLQDMSRAVGATQLGIVVADHQGKHQDERLRNRHHRLLETNSHFISNYQNFIETIFLTPSHLSVGIQFADMVAGAIGRKFNAGEDRFYLEIADSFRKSTRGQIDGYGLVKLPKSNWR